MTVSPIDLITARQQKVALRGIRVHSRLSGMGQQTTVEQTFVNMEKEAIEVTYAFPVPERAAVYGFEVVTGDRVLTGQIEETAKASETYEAAIARGDAAYGLRQHRPDVFSIDVGNIKPGQIALVRISYVSELEVADGRLRLAYPTVVAPRFATATGTDPLQALVDGQALNPPHVLEVPYGLSLVTEVALGRPVQSIQSPSHAIAVSPRGENEYRITLATGLTETNREIVLDLNLRREQEPHAEVGLGPDGRTYVAVTFMPELEEPCTPEPGEVVFVLDCSGSMQGKSITQARTALNLCLRNLSPGDVFNICRFGSHFEWMNQEPVIYSQETLDQAVGYIEAIDADLGGTELYGPLEDFLGKRPRTGTVRQVILLTDGQISNEPAVIALARKYRDRNRMFTFGIGPASSRHLVRGLAEATRGAAEFITGGERIEDKVLRTFSRLTTPNLTDLVIDWGLTDPMEQAPPEIPPVFDGDALTVYARCTGDCVPQQVTLKCHTASGRQSWTVNVPAAPWADRSLPTLWGRRMIQSLEDRAEPAEHRRLIELSRQFSVLCQETMFIAVEHRTLEERNDGAPATRRIPVQIPADWHGMDSSDMHVAGSACLRIACYDLHDTMEYSIESRRMFFGSSRFAADSSDRDEFAGLTLILSGQQANGSFLSTSVRFVSDWSDISQEAAAWLAEHCSGAGSESADEFIPTIVALIVLHRDYGDQQSLWKRAAKKGVRFLANRLNLKPQTVRTTLKRLADDA